jgi:hypothetical protein
MINGRTKGELEVYRDSVLALGLRAAPIPDEDFFGHYTLRLSDPDGNEVVVGTSHCAPAIRLKSLIVSVRLANERFT